MVDKTDIPNSVRTVLKGGRDALAAARLQPFAKPGHFYSPLSTPTEAQHAVAWRDVDVVGVELREAEQLELGAQLRPLWDELPSGGRYQPVNSQYPQADAMVLYSFLKHFAPKQVIEIGSGWSTAVMLDADVDTSITCIEPYPERLLGRLRTEDRSRLRLIRTGVQDVPLEDFQKLDSGDVLFIDSTHVVKPGSDVVWEFLHILPRLKPGVLVHVHDIFWPFEYPAEWLEQRRDWTELYLLRALLTGSSTWQIEFFSNWFWEAHPDLVPPQTRNDRPGGIWLRKIA
jgi:predicted O-methyltransferase YrrM